MKIDSQIPVETNTSNNGECIHMKNAKVELFDVALKGCDYVGVNIPNATSETIIVATRCEFANSYFGAAVDGRLTRCIFC